MLGELRPSRFFGDAFREIDAQVRAEGLAGPRLDRARLRCLGALSLAAVMLTLLYYYSGRDTFGWLCRRHAWLAPVYEPKFRELWGYAWWAGCHFTGYFLVPLCVTRFGFGIDLRAQGLALSGTRSKLWTYALLLGLVAPAVLAASLSGEFATYYPFYTRAGRSWFDLAVWEALYIAQFFALEYFFRGFLLATCRPTMGASAIFCVLLPYSMIHFGKPMSEALAAVVAGLVLGTLAMRTRSIWGGVVVHVGVALAMDLAALLQGVGLPEVWWPPG